MTFKDNYEDLRNTTTLADRVISNEYVVDSMRMDTSNENSLFQSNRLTESSCLQSYTDSLLTLKWLYLFQKKWSLKN